MKQVNKKNATVCRSWNLVQSYLQKVFKQGRIIKIVSVIFILYLRMHRIIYSTFHTPWLFLVIFGRKQLYVSPLGSCQLLIGAILLCYRSLVFSLRGRVDRNQSPLMWPVWLWHTATWQVLGGSLPLLSPAFRRSHFRRQVPVRSSYACTGIKLYLLPVRGQGWQCKSIPFVCLKELLVHFRHSVSICPLLAAVIMSRAIKFQICAGRPSFGSRHGQ